MNDSDYGPRPEQGVAHVATPRRSTPSASAIIRALLCLPLVSASLLFAAIALLGMGKLVPMDWPSLPGTCARAAETSLVCLALATPAAAFRPSLLWLLPLAATESAGAAGWALLPLPANQWMQVLEGAVLLLPVMVLAVGSSWRLIPPDLAETAAAAGASRARLFMLARLRPALPGIARGLALVFVLALGLAQQLPPM